MHRIAACLLAALVATSAQAQTTDWAKPEELLGPRITRPIPYIPPNFILGPPDPNPMEPAHYRNDSTLPTQTTLADCWLFEAQAWERSLDDWRYAAAWMCKDIAAKHARNDPLSDADLAMEQLLLAYEDAARTIMADILKDWDRRVSVIEQAKPDANPMLPKASVLRSAWLNMPSEHEAIASGLGLDAVLEAME